MKRLAKLFLVFAALLCVAASLRVINKLSDVPDIRLGPTTTDYVLTAKTDGGGSLYWTNLPPPGASGGEANVGQNLGSGTFLYAGKSGVNLQVNSLAAGGDLTLSSNANLLTFSGAAALTRDAEIDTLAELNTIVSDADLVALAGQLGGTAASPDVRGVRETTGPTLLTIGAINDGEFLKRQGTSIISATAPGSGDVTQAGNNAMTGNNTHAGRETFNGDVVFAQSSGTQLDWSATGDRIKTTSQSANFTVTETGTKTAGSTKILIVENTGSSDITVTLASTCYSIPDAANVTAVVVLANSTAALSFHYDGTRTIYWDSPKDNPRLRGIVNLGTGGGLLALTDPTNSALRSLVAPAAGLTIANPGGVAGNPTFALANDLSAVEGLTGTGLAARTGTDTWTVRTHTGTPNKIVVSNGDGASGNPTYDVGSQVYTSTGSGSRLPAEIGVAASDEATALTTGTAKVTFRMPFAMTVSSVRANLNTSQASGSIFTVDINEAGTSILSTKITIDNGEKTSQTAATAPVLSDTALADDAEITIDIDQIGASGAKGLKIWIIGTR